MSHIQAKRQRKLDKENGVAPKRKRLFVPLTFTVEGEEVYYPRVVRRKMLRAFTKALRTGKINMADVIAKRREHDRA